MTVLCRPGRRLLVESGTHLLPGTLSAVVSDATGKLWGLTAGHVLEPFNDGQRVHYFPEAARSLLGTYVAPARVAPDCDLAKIDAPPSLLSSTPVDIPAVPRLLPEADLQNARSARVVFIGGQVGRVAGVVDNVQAPGLIVRLSCSDLIPGDSGGPLHIEDGNIGSKRKRPSKSTLMPTGLQKQRLAKSPSKP